MCAFMCVISVLWLHVIYSSDVQWRVSKARGKCVCVCVCVRAREREREREREESGGILALLAIYPLNDKLQTPIGHGRESANIH